VQVFDGGLGVFGAAAVEVQVFHAHRQRAAGRARPFEGRPEGARVAQVQVAGGRGRKTAAIIRHRR
jgi:hypothetical protein